MRNFKISIMLLVAGLSAHAQMGGGVPMGMPPSGMQSSVPGLEVNPLSSCDLYPSSNSSAQLSSQIQQLQMLANTDPACRGMANSAMAFQTSSSQIMPLGFGAPPSNDISPHLATGLNQLITSFNSFMDASNEANPCARTQLGQEVRQNIGGAAVNIATQLAGVTPFAPVIGGLIGSIAQHLFRSLQGPNLKAINNKALSDEEKAKKYGCLYSNFSKMFLNKCDIQTGVGGYLSKNTSPIGFNQCWEGVLSAGVSRAQGFAEQILTIVQTQNDGSIKPISDSLRKSLQALGGTVVNTTIRSPDGSTEKNLKEWLEAASHYYSESGEDGFPRAPSLSNGISSFLAEIELMNSILRNPSVPESQIQESLARLQESIRSIQENAPLVAGSIASDTGVNRTIFSGNGQEISMPVGQPLVSGQGLVLTLMGYFRSTMPESYSRDKIQNDLVQMGDFQLQSNISLAMSAQGAELVPEREKNMAFNAIMAIVQDPIINHMKSLKQDTVPGGGRTPQLNCQGHIQLAKNCESLAGVFFHKVGNSGRNEYGANILTDKKIKDYQDLCGIYIEKGIIESPLNSNSSEENSCSRTLSNGSIQLTLNEENASSCADAFKKRQCGQPNSIDPREVTSKICYPDFDFSVHTLNPSEQVGVPGTATN